MRFKKEQLAELTKFLTPQQINILLDQNCQRKVVGSNVVLNMAEQAEALRRTQSKHYYGPAERPINSRAASKLESKYKLNKNLTDKQVEELIEAERKYGRRVLRMSPQEVRELLKHENNVEE